VAAGVAPLTFPCTDRPLLVCRADRSQGTVPLTRPGFRQ
jgi:hypothetical protein